MVRTQEILLKLGTYIELVVDETNLEFFHMVFDSYG